ncbi:MAG: alpha/beta hydrolase [Actinomycetota bacterium]|nr:alpha/beta hydrolase [Actinomycetota bacterium]
MNTIEVQGHSIAYRQQGDGPPLVLLHGWPTNSREWCAQLDGLSDEFGVVAWEAPGSGPSSDPPEEFRLPDWADVLAAFIQTLGLQHVHIGGLSWGGGLALELYRRHPTMVRSLILMGAYAGWGGSLPAATVEQRLQLMERNSRSPAEDWAPALIRTLVADNAPEEITDELASIIAELHPAATRTALRAFAEADLRDVLSRIDVPTLMVYGERDVRAPRSVWEPLQSTIPGAELVLIPDVGHMVDMEAPDRVNEEIRAFLRTAMVPRKPGTTSP